MPDPQNPGKTYEVELDLNQYVCFKEDGTPLLMWEPSVYEMMYSTLETLEASIIKAPMLGQIYTNRGKESKKFKKDGKTVIFEDDAFSNPIETTEA